jgi:hypothetical protein
MGNRPDLCPKRRISSKKWRATGLIGVQNDIDQGKSDDQPS